VACLSCASSSRQGKPLTVNLLTKYTGVLWCFLIFAPQTRPASQVVLQTPSKSLGFRKLPSREPFACVSPLAATLMDTPTSVANKRLRVRLTPLDATLTKNRGVGSAPPVRSAYPSLRPTPDICHPEANRRGSLKDLIANFKHCRGLSECVLCPSLATGHGPRSTGHFS
jgi:hypothetical protein